MNLIAREGFDERLHFMRCFVLAHERFNPRDFSIPHRDGDIGPTLIDSGKEAVRYVKPSALEMVCGDPLVADKEIIGQTMQLNFFCFVVLVDKGLSRFQTFGRQGFAIVERKSHIMRTCNRVPLRWHASFWTVDGVVEVVA